MIKEFKKNIVRYQGKWVIGVSGGPDSLALLRLFCECGIKPVVAHVNYGTRGKSSEMDEELVRSTSQKFRLRFYCKRESWNNEGNFQDWARKVRYGWFEKVRLNTGSDWIATAHHQDDQFETLVFRLMRGAAPGELTGIPERNGCIIRPLLPFPKSRLIEYLVETGQEYRLDESNLKDGYDRNYIRNNIIPELDKNYPDWREHIKDLPILGKEYQKSVDGLMESVLSGQNLDRGKFLKLPQWQQKAVLARWISEITGGTVSRKWLKAVSLDGLQTGSAIEVRQGWSLLRDRDGFKLINMREVEATINMVIHTPESIPPEGININKNKIGISEWSGSPQKDCLELDAAKIHWPVNIRNWRYGDRMQPLGMDGTKAVSDILTDSKVSAQKKPQSLVIEAFDGNLIAVIFPDHKNSPVGCISETVRCGKTTGQTLQIKPRDQ